MPWNVKLHIEFGLLETVYSGFLTDDDIKTSSIKLLSAAKGSGAFRFLSDLRDVTDIKVSDLTLYEQPEQWQGFRMKGKNKLAQVVPNLVKIMEAASFYETVCRNRGWNVQTFSQHKEAMSWLLTPY